eukprot:3205562-Pyramimonas_sp.AAC.1
MNEDKWRLGEERDSWADKQPRRVSAMRRDAMQSFMKMKSSNATLEITKWKWLQGSWCFNITTHAILTPSSPPSL